MQNTKKLLAMILCIIMITVMTIPAMAADSLESASSWAKEGITSALTKGFVPADIQGEYTNTITRQEFCRMAIKWLEYATGKSIDTLLSEKGVSRNPNAFTDTNDPDILAAYALGITSGTKAPTATASGTFSPNGQFSREQAATMVRNTCRVAGMDVSNTKNAGFTDISSASSWAVDGINYVRNAGIMGGTSTTPLMFSPKTTYTREQSIITFNNIKYGNSPGTQTTQSVQVGYEGFPQVPDFGVFSGANLVEQRMEEGMIGYVYSFNYDQAAIKKYEDMIVSAGYQFSSERLSEGGNKLRYFSNDYLLIATSATNSHYVVLLQDLTVLVKRYKEFSTVPDFAELAGGIVITSEVENSLPAGMVYRYYTNSANESAIDNYMKMLAALKWTLVDSSYTASGEMVFVLTKGDLDMVFAAQYPNNIHSIITIVVADNTGKYSMNVGNDAGNSTTKQDEIDAAGFEAWLRGDSSISDEAAYNYMQKNHGSSNQSGQGGTTFTLQSTTRIPASKGNVYQAPTELVMQSVNYVNISNPEKVRRGCTIQITSGKNALTGLWNSYTIDEDGKPGGTAFTVVDAVVID